jgi:DNA (cytosine-5)-methyltransferase 1
MIMRKVAPQAALFESDRESRFELVRNTARGLERVIIRRDGTEAVSSFPNSRATHGVSDAEATLDDADKAFLTEAIQPPLPKQSKTLTVIDLFCGVGGASVGLREAARALGFGFEIACAVDMDETALSVYTKNLQPLSNQALDLSGLSSVIGSTKTPVEVKLHRLVPTSPDILIAGPPCQGHSNLNNHTRRDDPKNELYFKVVRAVELLRPRAVFIENVPSVTRDRRKSMPRAAQALISLGYDVSHAVVDTSHIGVAQTRKRHILLAIDRQDAHLGRISIPSVSTIVSRYSVEPRPVMWAIDDLMDVPRDRFFDQVLGATEETQKRINYLFDNDMWDLPNTLRPDCHRLVKHTYPSVYGRMFHDRPAPTITSGFYTMGQGRFVHPGRRSTLTAHEAARIQFFPDWFDWSALNTRTTVSKGIGNAVPPKLSYVFALEVFR